MKKILTHLTGIVFIIAILVAGSCKQGTKDNAEPTTGNETKALASKDVDIFLKAILLEGEVHLLMYDSRKPGCEVIDTLVTVVYPGSTVIWQKAHKSNIKSVDTIRLIKAPSNFSISRDSIGLMNFHELIIPTTADTGTIKYDIEFTLKKDGGTHTIDPYLRIDD